MRILTFLLVSVLILSSCTSIKSSGHNYTPGRVDDNGCLTAINQFLNTSHDSQKKVIKGGAVEIRLADHFIRYLREIGTPELLFFVRVTIRDKVNPASVMVYDRIMQYSDGEIKRTGKGAQGGGQAMGGNLTNSIILPAMIYEGQDIDISFRVIELDQADNQRYNNLINFAATTTAAFKPEAAVAASAFQSVLNFMTSLNTDDIEFSYDISFSEEFERRNSYELNGKTYCAGLPLRSGTYPVLKTEHMNRLELPSLPENAADYITGFFGHTVGMLTSLTPWWPPYYSTVREEGWRWYEKKGSPFYADYKSTKNPYYRKDGVIEPVKKGAGHPMVFNGSKLLYRDDKKYRPYREKSYIVFTISNPPYGAILSELAKTTHNLKDFNIRTSQLSPKELHDQLNLLSNRLGKTLLLKTYKERIAAAKGSADKINAIENEYRASDEKAKIAIDNAQKEALTHFKERQEKYWSDIAKYVDPKYSLIYHPSSTDFTIKKVGAKIDRVQFQNLKGDIKTLDFTSIEKGSDLLLKNPKSGTYYFYSPNSLTPQSIKFVAVDIQSEYFQVADEKNAIWQDSVPSEYEGKKVIVLAGKDLSNVRQIMWKDTVLPILKKGVLGGNTFLILAAENSINDDSKLPLKFMLLDYSEKPLSRTIQPIKKAYEEDCYVKPAKVLLTDIGGEHQAELSELLNNKNEENFIVLNGKNAKLITKVNGDEKNIFWRGDIDKEYTLLVEDKNDKTKITINISYLNLTASDIELNIKNVYKEEFVIKTGKSILDSIEDKNNLKYLLDLLKEKNATMFIFLNGDNAELITKIKGDEKNIFWRGNIDGKHTILVEDKSGEKEITVEIKYLDLTPRVIKLNKK